MWLNVILAKLKSSQCWSAVVRESCTSRWHAGFLESHVLLVSAVWGAVRFRQHFVKLFHFFPLPFPPLLVDLVSKGLVSISTDLVSVMVPDGWLLLAELPWLTVCPAQGLWLKARCSPQNHRPLWQAPSPSSSIGDELKLFIFTDFICTLQPLPCTVIMTDVLKLFSYFWTLENV